MENVFPQTGKPQPRRLPPTPNVSRTRVALLLGVAVFGPFGGLRAGPLGVPALTVWVPFAFLPAWVAQGSVVLRFSGALFRLTCCSARGFLPLPIRVAHGFCGCLGLGFVAAKGALVRSCRGAHELTRGFSFSWSVFGVSRSHGLLEFQDEYHCDRSPVNLKVPKKHQSQNCM